MFKLRVSRQLLRPSRPPLPFRFMPLDFRPLGIVEGKDLRNLSSQLHKQFSDAKIHLILLEPWWTPYIDRVLKVKLWHGVLVTIHEYSSTRLAPSCLSITASGPSSNLLDSSLVTRGEWFCMKLIFLIYVGNTSSRQMWRWNIEQVGMRAARHTRYFKKEFECNSHA